MILVAALVAAQPGARAQSVEPAERGRAVIDAALQALGGRDRVSAVPAWLAVGRGRENLSAEGQGLEPDRPTWRSHQESIAIESRTLGVAWERRTPRNDRSLRWRRFVLTADSSGFTDWVARQGTLGANPAPEARRRAMARRIPHLLLLDAATRGSARWVAERRFAGRLHDVVEADLPDAGRLTLWVGRDPAILSRAEYLTHIPGRGDALIGWEWRGWKRDPNLGFVPQGHRIDVGGTLYQEVTYSRFAVDSAGVRAMVTVPAEVRSSMHRPAGASSAAPAAERLPATGEVAPGVHLVSVGGFTLMFVDLGDFVVAVEAPEAARGLEAIPATGGPPSLTSSYLARIHAGIPGKPVRYAILTHHHGDHLGGVRLFAAEGATLIVAPGHRRAVLAALDAPHTVAPDGWRTSSADGRVESVPDRRTLGDGARRLEIINVGANPHTRENLVVWLPEERILFQGDLFYYSEGGPFPPSGRGTMNRFFARRLEARRIAPRAVYGVHNDGAVGPDRLAQAARAVPPGG